MARAKCELGKGFGVRFMKGAVNLRVLVCFSEVGTDNEKDKLPRIQGIIFHMKYFSTVHLE